MQSTGIGNRRDLEPDEPRTVKAIVAGLMPQTVAGEDLSKHTISIFPVTKRIRVRTVVTRTAGELGRLKQTSIMP